MTTKPSLIRRFFSLIALGIAAILVLVCARLFISPATFDWPAWVQAVGSISAILVAVWVSSDQVNQQRLRDEAKDQAELTGVLRSLAAEVETTLEYSAKHVETAFGTIPSGLPVGFTFPLPEYPFPIFDALIPKLGVIPDDGLQRNVIHTYALAKSVAMTVLHHNTLVAELAAIEARQRENPSETAVREVQLKTIQLTLYSTALGQAIGPLKVELQTLLDALRRASSEV